MDRVGRRVCLDATGGVTGGVPDLRSSGSGDVRVLTSSATGLATGGSGNVTLGTTSTGLAGLVLFVFLTRDNKHLQHPMIDLCPCST